MFTNQYLEAYDAEYLLRTDSIICIFYVYFYFIVSKKKSFITALTLYYMTWF